jgi:hypothetical protein
MKLSGQLYPEGKCPSPLEDVEKKRKKVLFQPGAEPRLSNP